MVDLYAGGYASVDSNIDDKLRQGIINLCKDLLEDAVTLADVLAPPDHIVNSPLGMADGNVCLSSTISYNLFGKSDSNLLILIRQQVYEHIQEKIFQNKENLERPTWWREILQSKL